MTDQKNFAPSRLRVNDLLEQHFDTAFAAPDGIKKLRELILTLAMQGKLVEQDPNDPPASELLKEIEEEKQQLIKEKKIRNPKPLPPIKPEEIPYELPQGWEWVRLIEIGSWALGSGLPHSIQGDSGQEILLCKVSDMNLPGNEKFIVTANNTVSEKVVQQSKLNISEPRTIIFPKIGGAIATNKRRILQTKTVIDNNCLGIAPASAMDLEWCYQLLLGFDFAKYQTGTSVPAISQGTIGEIVIGLPPLPEQQRIVARIDQLMARCDELEKLRKEREEKRLAVHAAAIKQLLDPTHRAFAPSREKNLRAFVPSCETFAFISQHFGELYTVKENVAELRKAILQLAVMGRLVEQDPNDPPASELLQQIVAEKQRLIKEKKIKKPNPLPPIKPEEVPYELPHGWEWVRLNDTLDVRDGTHDTPKYVDDGYPLVTSKNIYTGSLSLEDVKYITKEDHEKIAERSRVDKGDILFAMIGSIGNPVIVDSDIEFSIKNVALFKYVIEGKPSNRYLHYYLIYAQENMKAISSGAVQSFVSLGFLRNYLLPLPPLPEQERIVARIDQLMALCDTLDQQIDAATGKQTALLNAVMAGVNQGRRDGQCGHDLQEIACPT